MSYMIN